MTIVTTSLQGALLRISWTAPSNNNGAAVTGYRIKLLNKFTNAYEEHSSICNGASSLVTDCDIAMSTLINSLGYVAGDAVKVTLSAQNSIGFSTQSDPVTSTQLVQIKPHQMAGLVATTLSATSIKLDWTSITAAPTNGYSAVTKYEVFWNVGTGTTPDTSILNITDATTATNTFTSLTTGSTYYFKILATNIHGTSVDSDIVNSLAGSTVAVHSAVAVTQTSTNVVLTWTDTSSINGDAVTAQRVKILNKNNDQYEEFTALCDASAPALRTCSIPMTSILSTLAYQPGEIIKAKVASKNSFGWNADSTENSSGTLAQTSPYAPSGLTLTVNSKTSVTLAWTA